MSADSTPVPDRPDDAVKAVAEALIREGCGSGWAYPRARKIIVAYERSRSGPDSATQGDDHEPTERDLELDAAGAEAGWDGATTAAERTQGEDHEAGHRFQPKAFCEQPVCQAKNDGHCHVPENCGHFQPRERWVPASSPDSATEPDTAKLTDDERKGVEWAIDRGIASLRAEGFKFPAEQNEAILRSALGKLAGFSVDAGKPDETTRDLRTDVGDGLAVKPLGHTPPVDAGKPEREFGEGRTQTRVE